MLLYNKLIINMSFSNGGIFVFNILNKILIIPSYIEWLCWQRPCLEPSRIQPSEYNC